MTPATRALLDHWHAEDRFRRLFFCQIEALETLIFITEVAKQTKYGQDWIEKYLKEKADEAGTELFRVACKMATGSGKTVVMSMLVAWQVLNKRRYPHDNRFTDCFLVVAPGITIRDRLRVLLPSDPNNYYRELDSVPTEYRGDLGTAKIVVTNFHAFKQRERGDASGLTKRVLTANTPGAFTESPDEMMNRVCNDLGKHREIMVINDEAHHCYRGKPAETKGMTAEEKKEAKARDEEARLWITGLEAVHKKIGTKAVFDLSATPFYLKGSGYPEGTLFPWVVFDFSLMDAIECGIVKIPRVPIADNAMTGDYPKYRNLWVDIREGLKDVRRGPEDAHKPPLLPGLLEGALKSLYNHYARKFAEWEADEESRANGSTPPVFIVVCNNTNVSKAVFDYVAGYETEHLHPDTEPKVAPGALALFSNEKDQRWRHQPNTILVDSRQLESGESMSDDFKKFAAHQIEDFKAEYRKRSGADAENLTDEDLMREVLNTVGKKGKLGEHVRCVVSVSMLTEGWDCTTVTHILGVRAFGTRLLCEQVMGRGLRRRSYTVGDDGMMTPEYADIFGVPFSGFPVAGLPEERAPATPKPGKAVRAVPERLVGASWLEVTFPRMAKKKPGASVPVDAHKHVADTRPNIPTRETAAFATDDGLQPFVVKRDRSLDPQLVWKGKDEQDAKPLEVPAVPIHVQEKIHPQAIVEDVRARAVSPTRQQGQPSLFDDFNGLNDFEKTLQFYQHDQRWTNRLILGDSLLVMASLAEKERLRGKVQCIYFDPPYGIKFGSNWQVSTRKRDVKDARAEDLTRQPEQVKAFRDTWELGIHSYLSYMRDRLAAARDLLTESGSIFVRIGDENVHRVRALLDEVFGDMNFCGVITYKKTTTASTDRLAGVSDSLIWYTKNAEQVKYRQLYLDKQIGAEGASQYTWTEHPDGTRKNYNNFENLKAAPKESRLFTHDNITSQRPLQGADLQEFVFQGRSYRPAKGTFKTDFNGLTKLAAARRLLGVGDTLRYLRFLDDFGVYPLVNLWDDTVTSGFAEKKVYVVQTNPIAVQRCILMTTDPGDLVLDPTCGSSTTAYVAEQWGRRWITDTSRVALALARTRLMAARFPYYLLADSAEGRKKQSELTGTPPDPTAPDPQRDMHKGFVYRVVPHVTLKSIANKPDIKGG